MDDLFQHQKLHTVVFWNFNPMAIKTCRRLLLNCAPEIRNAIYGYEVLSFDNTIIRGQPMKAASTSLSLLRVSKSVEREAAPIFYK